MGFVPLIRNLKEMKKHSVPKRKPNLDCKVKYLFSSCKKPILQDIINNYCAI